MALAYDNEGQPYITTDYGSDSSGGIDLGGFNPADLNPATGLPTSTIGSDIFYRNADGSYTGINSETGNTYSLSESEYNQMAGTTGTGTGSVPGATGSGVTAGSASGIGNLLTKLFTNKSGDLNPIAVGALLGGLGGLSGLGQANRNPTGYQGSIPKYTATRDVAPAGQRISGNVTYTKKAEGGELESGGFVIPADVVSHFGNGSSDAGLKLLKHKLGARPIRGEGDGMSDSIPTTIDGEQRALVAHEEAYMSPDQVAKLGGGDASKGAHKLRTMMAKIREARTGSTEQGRKINPSKFMPGGEVQRYATGDVTGSAISNGLTGTESNLSNWAGDYVTNMLGKGQALSEMPYEPYTGPLTAGASDLQTQAFGQAANLQTPAAIGQAANTAGNIASKLQDTSYAPTTFGNQFTAPSAYQTGTFDTGTFGSAEAQQYMNPYLATSLAPQLAELQRQNKIANLADMSKLTQAGAYGGSRQAVLQAENTRNLMDKINQVTGQGYNTAYTNALSQFNADQARKLQAQQAAEQSRQFGAGQAMTGAQQAAQYGLAGQQAGEASRQFGATLGLQGLQSALQAAQTQGQLGATQQQANINNLQELASLGATQRGIAAEDVAAQKAAFEEARQNPYKMVQFQQSLLSGLPLAATTYNTLQPSTLQQALSGLLGGATLGKLLGTSSTSGG